MDLAIRISDGVVGCSLLMPVGEELVEEVSMLGESIATFTLVGFLEWRGGLHTLSKRRDDNREASEPLEIGKMWPFTEMKNKRLP